MARRFFIAINVAFLAVGVGSSDPQGQINESTVPVQQQGVSQHDPISNETTRVIKEEVEEEELDPGRLLEKVRALKNLEIAWSKWEQEGERERAIVLQNERLAEEERQQEETRKKIVSENQKVKTAELIKKFDAVSVEWRKTKRMLRNRRRTKRLCCSCGSKLQRE